MLTRFDRLSECRDLVQRVTVEGVVDPPPVAAIGDQAGVFERPEVEGQPGLGRLQRILSSHTHRRHVTASPRSRGSLVREGGNQVRRGWWSGKVAVVIEVKQRINDFRYVKRWGRRPIFFRVKVLCCAASHKLLEVAAAMKESRRLSPARMRHALIAFLLTAGSGGSSQRRGRSRSRRASTSNNTAAWA